MKGLSLLVFLFQGFLVISQEVILDEESEIDIFGEDGELRVEYTEVIENMTAEMDDIIRNADGVILFLDSLQESVENQEDVVKIPLEIDPEERSISVDDALGKIEDFVRIEMMTTQSFLEQLQNLMSEVNNETRVFEELAQMKRKIDSVMQEYTEAMEVIAEQRQSMSINRMYEYMYGEEGDADASIEDDGSPINMKMLEEFAPVPYGNDAHHEDDKDNEQSTSTNVVIVDLLKKSSYSTHMPTFAYVCIGLSIAAFLLIIAVSSICICRKRQNVKSPPPSLAEETKKDPIAIVTIPVDYQKTATNLAYEENELPGYLDVICDKI